MPTFRWRMMPRTQVPGKTIVLSCLARFTLSVIYCPAMAKDDERPQFNPKHRIAGAIILVSLAVIFVPMLLDESNSPAENQTLTKIPERDTADTKVVIAPVAPPVADSARTPSAEPEVAKMPSDKPVATAKLESAPEPQAP